MREQEGVDCLVPSLFRPNFREVGGKGVPGFEPGRTLESAIYLLISHPFFIAVHSPELKGIYYG